MRVLLKNLMVAVQSINSACTDFWSPYLVQMGPEIRQSVPDVDTDSLLSQNWPPSPLVHHGSCKSCSETESATTDWNGRKKTEKNARNTMEFLNSVDLGKIWPPLLQQSSAHNSKSMDTMSQQVDLECVWCYWFADSSSGCETVGVVVLIVSNGCATFQCVVPVNGPCHRYPLFQTDSCVGDNCFGSLWHSSSDKMWIFATACASITAMQSTKLLSRRTCCHSRLTWNAFAAIGPLVHHLTASKGVRSPYCKQCVCYIAVCCTCTWSTPCISYVSNSFMYRWQFFAFYIFLLWHVCSLEFLGLRILCFHSC